MFKRCKTITNKKKYAECKITEIRGVIKIFKYEIL